MSRYRKMTEEDFILLYFLGKEIVLHLQLMYGP